MSNKIFKTISIKVTEGICKKVAGGVHLKIDEVLLNISKGFLIILLKKLPRNFKGISKEIAKQT